jgi:hypothetical protein
MVWWRVHAVTAVDTFKIQNVNVVQSVGVLGLLKKKIELKRTEDQ